MNYNNLELLLNESNHDATKTQFLVNGFKDGFDLGYRGPKLIRQKSRNLKFTIGNKTELWNKVMKEVEAKRYAGPFEEIPFDNYIQSPIGLVPKDKGLKTRIIFHLSHPRNSEKGVSINGSTPENLTSVTYPKFDEAVELCIQQGCNCCIAKSDMTAAFRHFGIAKKYWKFLVMKAQHPKSNKWYYFIDKCMPFGASISCSHFQRFSNAIAHIVKYKTEHDNINYLDDFFFAALLKMMCNDQIRTFLEVCRSINFPVSKEKTFWASTRLTFLGLLIDTELQMVFIPMDKILATLELTERMLGRKNNKTTLRELQKLTGMLNFLGKAIVPGRAFTRRLYSYGNPEMKPHHHIYMDKEMKNDLETWLSFLRHPTVFGRKFIDFDRSIHSEEVSLYSDASANPELGCGGISDNEWYILQWDENFIRNNNPSINYLELYAVTIGIFNWIHKYENRRITLFCDNMSVVQMINNNSAKCKNCMILIRIIVLKELIHNVKIHAKHVPGNLNTFSDLLSRLRYKEFRNLARKKNMEFSKAHTPIPEELWPMNKVWLS